MPNSAVLASVPLLQILKRLPSYFLGHDISDTKGSPMFNLAWDYTRKKSSYRQFCQAVSDRFLQMPIEKRLRDTVAGSVRLALALLRPHFHEHICDDFTVATTYVCELACVIAQFPGQWWSREHPEIRELIRCIVHMVGEEMREARRKQALADATRMQEMVCSLKELVAKAREARPRPGKIVANITFSPDPSPSPTLPPSPTVTRKKALRLSSLDIITDDMTADQSVPQPSPVEQPDNSEIPVQECKSSTYVPSYPSTTNRALEAVARSASCFLTGLLVGSFIL